MCVFGSYRKLGQTKNHFCVDCKIRAHSYKSISSFVFISNHLHSSHNTPSSSQITHSSHSSTILSILSHMHSSPIAHPSTDESHPSTGEIVPQTHEPIDPPSEWPTPRSTHHLQIGPPRPSASHTHKLIFLCPSLTIGLVILIFCFDFCFLCCLYILILCNNICLHPKKMWETW